ncbi:MAG: hypothetical protein LBD04_00060 [Synergistaceae bacterium]|jgi:V/A-type H+-transporting ATPase subunit E|nr:hypothetical protein [Synergistaceae bacterium]
MTEGMTEAPGKAARGGAVVYDERKKLAELQAMILGKGDAERERVLSEARQEAVKWVEDQTKQLEGMAASIKSDAAKRAREITSRQLIEAEAARDKSRLRLQSDLARKALVLLQDALSAFDKRPDYDAILTGVAAEACERFPGGQKVKMRFRAEDAVHGEAVAQALKLRFPNLDVTFDATPAPIMGGVYLYSEEEKWRVVADWKTKVEEMADGVAKAVLAEL